MEVEIVLGMVGQLQMANCDKKINSNISGCEKTKYDRDNVTPPRCQPTKKTRTLDFPDRVATG